jgi:rare lipoprotein A
MSGMKRWLKSLFLIAVLGIAGCNPPPKAPERKLPEQAYFTETGAGSFYSNRLTGKKTASGGRFTQHDFTAAHQSLPFGTIVKVTNMDNGLSIKVAIDDRGPFAKGRVIDLSSAAAQALGIHEEGIATVKLEAFKTDQPRSTG